VSPTKMLANEGEQVDARELLVRASARLVETWGLFENGLVNSTARIRECIERS
jgi:hypothetical protein